MSLSWLVCFLEKQAVFSLLFGFWFVSIGSRLRYVGYRSLPILCLAPGNIFAKAFQSSVQKGSTSKSFRFVYKILTVFALRLPQLRTAVAPTCPLLSRLFRARRHKAARAFSFSALWQRSSTHLFVTPDRASVGALLLAHPPLGGAIWVPFAGEYPVLLQYTKLRTNSFTTSSFISGRQPTFW